LSSIDLSNFLVDREVAEPISDILTLDHNIQKLIIQNCGLEDEVLYIYKLNSEYTIILTC
jgi:hypothetical protein